MRRPTLAVPQIKNANTETRPITVHRLVKIQGKARTKSPPAKCTDFRLSSADGCPRVRQASAPPKIRRKPAPTKAARISSLNIEYLVDVE